MDLDKIIRKVPDFPKPGILFYDVPSLFTNPQAFRYIVSRITDFYGKEQIDGVVAIEARGFVPGACFALEHGLPLVLARKKGKHPGKTIAESYALEYGHATIEIQIDDLPAGKRWLIVDDLIATGGTLEAVAKLIERQGSSVAGVFGIVGLPFLNYAARIGKYGPRTLIDYQGE